MKAVHKQGIIARFGALALVLTLLLGALPQPVRATTGPITLDGLEIRISNKKYDHTTQVNGNKVVYTIDGTRTQTMMSGDLGWTLLLKFRAKLGENDTRINYDTSKLIENTNGYYEEEDGDWTGDTQNPNGYKLNSLAYTIDKTSDANYYLYSFRLYAGAYADRAQNGYTDYTIRIHKYPQKRVGAYFNYLYLGATQLYGPDFAPMAAGTDYREYLAAQNVTFPYTIRIVCGAHVDTRATIDGEHFIGRLDRNVTLTAQKPYVELALVPYDRAHNEEKFYLPTKWRIAVTGTDPASPNTPGAKADPKNPEGKPVVQVAFPQKSIVLRQGASVSLPAGAYTEGGSATVAYTSSKPELAAVSQSGKITAGKRKTGTAKITAEAGGKRATLTVKVVAKGARAAKAKGVSANLPKTMKAGQVRQITAKYTPAAAQGVRLSFSSSKKAVAGIDQYGRLTAHKKGVTVITVKGGGLSRRYRLTVR